MSDLKQDVANYLTRQFVALPHEVPADECHREAAHVIGLVVAFLKTTDAVTLAGKGGAYELLDAQARSNAVPNKEDA